MKKITSFTIDHTKLLPGLYVSREDIVDGNVITTFDLRVCKPNTGDVLAIEAAHTIEHIAATYLRNNELWQDKVIYFGPMGCLTGFYMILAGKYSSEDVLPLVRDCFTFTANFEGDIPGASAVECGNYLSLNLESAKVCAKKYVDILTNITPPQLVYHK
jgi:S-ribosylhomocysteine lyase